MENKDIIIKKIIHILQSKDNIIFAYIFGSFASSYTGKFSKRGEHDTHANNFFNDIDIAIYLSKTKKPDPLSFEIQLENELENMLGFNFDVRIINDAPLPFQYNVIKDSIVIIDRDDTLRADFEGLVMKKYFDFMHIRNEYLREIPNAKI